MLAGASLTAFCYNRVQNQRLIAKICDLFFSRFHSLIQSKDEIHSANASFQASRYVSSFRDDDAFKRNNLLRHLELTINKLVCCSG